METRLKPLKTVEYSNYIPILTIDQESPVLKKSHNEWSGKVPAAQPLVFAVSFAPICSIVTYLLTLLSLHDSKVSTGACVVETKMSQNMAHFNLPLQGAFVSWLFDVLPSWRNPLQMTFSTRLV